MVFENEVGAAQVPQSPRHFEMILSVVPLRHLEGALVHFFGLAIVPKVSVREAQVVQSGTNVVRIITEFAPEDLEVIILFYLQCPFEELLLRSEVPKTIVGDVPSRSTSSQLRDDALRSALL